MDEPSMPDFALHDLLERAIGEPPTTTVDIGLARSRGQRRRHWRRGHGAAAGGTVAAVAAAAVALFSGAGQSHPVRPGSAATPSQTALAPPPPRRFSLSTPY